MLEIINLVREPEDSSDRFEIIEGLSSCHIIVEDCRRLVYPILDTTGKFNDWIREYYYITKAWGVVPECAHCGDSVEGSSVEGGW